MLLQQQITETLLKAVDDSEQRMLAEILLQAHQLIRTQIVPMATHEREQAAVFGAHRIEIAASKRESPDSSDESHESDRPQSARSADIYARWRGRSKRDRCTPGAPRPCLRAAAGTSRAPLRSGPAQRHTPSDSSDRRTLSHTRAYARKSVHRSPALADRVRRNAPPPGGAGSAPNGAPPSRFRCPHVLPPDCD